MESNSSVPSAGSRRVSILIALPVILTCAVTGSVLGVTHPIRSFFSFVDPSERTVEPAAAPQASASDKPDVEAAATPPPPAPPSATTAEEPRAAVARAGEERSGVGVPAAMPLPPPPSPSLALPAFPAAEPAPVSTGSVERSLSPGPVETGPPKESVAGETLARAGSDRAEAAQADVERRHAVVNPRVARAKRLRRAMTRRPIAKAPGSPVETFFTSFFTKN